MQIACAHAGPQLCLKSYQHGLVSVLYAVVGDCASCLLVLPVLQVWDKALSSRLDRGSTFLALGGGVVGDMTGFAAACYQRGVHFVQVPTTVMSQVGDKSFQIRETRQQEA